MTHKSIKLLALAVICGCSLIGFSITPGGDGRLLLLLFVFLVTAPWFLLYWFRGEDRRR
jgi:hypothetical protein